MFPLAACGMDLTRMECKDQRRQIGRSWQGSIDLTRMECKACNCLFLSMYSHCIDLTRMECKVSYKSG